MTESDSDELRVRKKRALYRSTHRGTKELDFMLGRFAEAHVDAMDADQLSRYEELIALQDPEIDQYVRGKQAPDNVRDLVASLRVFLGMTQ